MKKYKEVKDIVCPFCGNKPKLVCVSEYFPKLYCVNCQCSLSYQINWNSSKYIFEESHKENYCKKHNDTYDEYCYKCEKEIKQKKFSKLKFNKNQLKFLSEYDYEINEMAKKELKCKSKK